MAKLRVLETAEYEFDQAFNWYLNQSVRAAERFVAEFESAMDAIRKHPDQQLRLDNTHHIRMLKWFPYFVAFRNKPDELLIVAVRHTSQDDATWKDR